MEGTLAYVINQHSSRVAFYTIRAAVYRYLLANEQAIETVFGARLLWTEREDGKTSRIAYDMPPGGYKDEADWERAQAEMIGAMTRLESALAPHVAALAAAGR